MRDESDCLSGWAEYISLFPLSNDCDEKVVTHLIHLLPTFYVFNSMKILKEEKKDEKKSDTPNYLTISCSTLRLITFIRRLAFTSHQLNLNCLICPSLEWRV